MIEDLFGQAGLLREFGSWGVLVGVLWYTLRQQNAAIKALASEINTLTDTLRPKEGCNHENDS